ncbi:MAG: hypothetical protein JWO84_729 [Parcubacteria group bacterium]|nr:hypothetical protein [Parcubacteria group bacterium]
MIGFLRSFGVLAFVFIMLPYTIAAYGTIFWQGDTEAWCSVVLFLAGLTATITFVYCVLRIVMRQVFSPYVGWALWTVLCTVPGIAILGFAPLLK